MCQDRASFDDNSCQLGFQIRISLDEIGTTPNPGEGRMRSPRFLAGRKAILWNVKGLQFGWDWNSESIPGLTSGTLSLPGIKMTVRRDVFAPVSGRAGGNAR